MKELMYIRSFSKRRLPVIVGTLLLVIIGSVWLNTAPFRSGFDIADELGGNIFPSSILSVATTDAQVIVPVDSMYVGNPKSCIAVRVRSRNAYSRVRVEVAETPFFSRSVSEFVLAKPRTEYIIYPDIIWNYEALKNNNQAEALDTRIVNRFLGYQGGAEVVDRQVYALWNVLQKRKFRYSSVSNTSLSSNVVFSQRVRTFDDALESSQINCVDGSVLFASLLRAINIEPILVRTPGHMFVGYYTDSSHKDMNFLETTMIGDVDLDDFFPDEQLDSTMVGKSQNQMSRITFDKSKEYANKKYAQNKEGIHSGKLNYMFLEISKEVRRRIQPIGK